MSREFARLLDAELPVTTSAFGGGSQFCFEFDARLAGSSVRPRRRVEGLVAGTTAPVVLVVDDQAESLAVLAGMLDGIGCEVIPAASGEAALAAIAASLPDIVFTDLRMPGMDGIEVLRGVRAIPGGRALPVVFVTASVMAATQDLVDELGATAVLLKPVLEYEVFQTLATYTGVEYDYVDEGPVDGGGSAGFPNLVAMVEQLPAELRDGLRDAVYAGNLSDIEACLGRVRQESAVLWKRLRHLVTEFDYAAVLELLGAESPSTSSARCVPKGGVE